MKLTNALIVLSLVLSASAHATLECKDSIKGANLGPTPQQATQVALNTVAPPPAAASEGSAGAGTTR